MIRRKFFLLSVLYVLILHALAFAALYQSNILGQRLAQIEQSDRENYEFILEVLEEDESIVSILYNNMSVLSKEVTTTSDDMKTVVETTYDNDKIVNESTRVYDSGLLQSVSTDDEGHTIEYDYIYENNQLIEEKKLVDTRLDSLTTFYRFYDGSLAGTRVIDRKEGTFVTLYDSDGDVSTLVSDADNRISLYRIYPNGVVDDDQVMTSDAFYDESGNLLISENIEGIVKKSMYSPKGKLLSVDQIFPDGESESMVYEYDTEGNITHSVNTMATEDTTRIERWYTEGKLKSQTEWVNDIPERSVKYLEDGTSIVTIFEQGIPYTDVTYATDGKRVLSIEYRKEQ
ncbi:MAG: hypothetical protein ACPKOP_09080 [Sphaerochaetaceae bacterium]